MSQDLGGGLLMRVESCSLVIAAGVHMYAPVAFSDLLSSHQQVTELVEPVRAMKALVLEFEPGDWSFLRLAFLRI